MTTIRIIETTTVTPEQFIAAITDFGPGRSTIFPTSEPEFFQIHAVGDSWADVTEGASAGGGVWERLRYDWSTPRVVTARTTDSNTWGRDSGHTYTLRSLPDGRTEIDVVVVREGVTAKGRVLGVLLTAIGKNFARTGLRATVAAVEARVAAQG